MNNMFILQYKLSKVNSDVIELLRNLDKYEFMRLFVGKIPLAKLSYDPKYIGQLPQEVIEAFLN